MSETLWNSFQSERHLSKDRLHSFKESSHSQRELYEYDLQLSSAFHTPLAVFEVVLRNAIHDEFSKSFQRKDWWEKFRGTEMFAVSIEKIDKAVRKLEDNDKSVTPNSIVAELSLGFWVNLFSKNYTSIFWKPLSKCFWKLEKKNRQRETVSPKLQDIRDFRNRVFHHEPVFRKKPKRIMNDINEVLFWLAPGSVDWLATINRVPLVIADFEKKDENETE